MRSSTSRQRPSKSIVFSRSSRGDTLNATQPQFSATQVRALRSFCVRSCMNGPFAGVVHAVTYSLLLLNTDLHVAELASRMSRGQFVRNTLATIQMQLQPNQGSNSDLSYDDWTSFRAGSDSDVGGTTIRSRAKRSDSIASWNSIATRDGGFTPSPLTVNSSGQLSSTSDGAGQAQVNGSTVSVALSTGQEVKEAKSSDPPPATFVPDRNWETEMENTLKVRSRA